MKHILPFLELKILADRVLKSFELPRIDHISFWKLYYGDNPQPVIINGERVRVWIDRFYLAYQQTGRDVVYVYITRTHIDEELESYAELKLYRNTDADLPEDIVMQFEHALWFMRKYGTDVYTKSMYINSKAA